MKEPSSLRKKWEQHQPEPHRPVRCLARATHGRSRAVCGVFTAITTFEDILKGSLQMIWVALFRGINVGGSRKVPMSELKKLHEELGFKDVATYIQSGNVIFSSDDTENVPMEQQIEESFAKKFGFHSKVLVRSSDDFKTIIAHNPFEDQPTKESKWVLVFFLATQPASTAFEDLQNTYSGPEELHLHGQHLYIYYPEGMGRSKLSNALLEKKLKTPGTGRNWNTVLQLQNLLERYEAAQQTH